MHRVILFFLVVVVTDHHHHHVVVFGWWRTNLPSKTLVLLHSIVLVVVVVRHELFILFRLMLVPRRILEASAPTTMMELAPLPTGQVQGRLAHVSQPPGQRFWTNLGCLDDVQESSMFSHLIELAKAVGRRNDSIRCLFKRWFLFERRRNENLVSQSERKNFQEFQGEQKVFYRIYSTIDRERDNWIWILLLPFFTGFAHSNWNSPPKKKLCN